MITRLNANAIEDESIAKSKLDTSLKTEIDGKQEALTLTVKDNGNIVLANIQGQSKEFMPATPSGDPMHYAYVTAGAEYNDTGADIVKTAPWADMIDDDYTGDYGKTVVHKAGYWYLNGLGDITNDEIRKIYQLTSAFPENVNMNERFKSYTIRTNFYTPSNKGGYDTPSIIAFSAYSQMIVVGLQSAVINKSNIAFTNSKVRHFIGTQNSFTVQNDTFTNANYLTTIVIGSINTNIIILSPVLSIKSVLYMINNEKATSPITITLHADVYNRCMANADILAALEAHTNVSLASA